MGKFRDNPAAANVSPIKATISWNAKEGVFLYYHYESETKFEVEELDFFIVEPSMFRVGCSSSMRTLPYRIKSNFGIMGENDLIQIVRDDTQAVIYQGNYAKNKTMKDIIGYHKGRYESCIAGFWVTMTVKTPNGSTEVRKNESKEMAIFKLHGGAISECITEFEKRENVKMGDLDGTGLKLESKNKRKGSSKETTSYWYPTINLHPGFKLKDGNTLSFETFFETRFMDEPGQMAAYKELRTYLENAWAAIGAGYVAAPIEAPEEQITGALAHTMNLAHSPTVMEQVVEELPGVDDDLPF